jgi:hypothetical protein
MSVGAGPATSTGASAVISRPRSTTSESNSAVWGYSGAGIVTKVAQMRDFFGTDTGAPPASLITIAAGRRLGTPGADKLLMSDTGVA